jgi:hypothetical protein
MRGIVLGAAVIVMLAVALWGSIVVSDSIWRSYNQRGDEGYSKQIKHCRPYDYVGRSLPPDCPFAPDPELTPIPDRSYRPYDPAR